jgi:hypothetical protein
MRVKNEVIDADCRFCSAISKANGEEPIGTAATSDYWLIVELPQPWSEIPWPDSPQLKPLVASIKELILKDGVRLKPIAIAPDPEYSRPGYTRILYYYRPGELFAQYEKREYIVPDNLIGELVTELLKLVSQKPGFLTNTFAKIKNTTCRSGSAQRNPTKTSGSTKVRTTYKKMARVLLTGLEQYRQETSRVREMLVCTHANVDVACGRFGYPIYKKLRSQYAASSNGNLRVWRSSHFGGHRFAPTLVDLPEGRYWGHLEPEMLDLLLLRNSSVSGLRPFYRGWAGLGSLEQIVEREIWMREGWDWLKYPKTGRVLAAEENQTRVQLEFALPDGKNELQLYEAVVEVNGEVMSASRSGEELKAFKQYRVASLEKVER